MEKKFCSQCNNQVIKSLMFCPKCGSVNFATQQNINNTTNTFNTNSPNPPPIQTSNYNNIQSSVPADNYHPWRRFFAKSIDMYIFGLIFNFAIGAMFPHLLDKSNIFNKGNEYIATYVSMFFYFPFEAFCLFSFGSTIGKSIYNITLIKNSPNVASFGAYFHRSFNTWFFGMGAGIPLVNLFAQLVAYIALEKHGLTSWDRKLNWTVIHNHMSFGRWCIVAMTWLLIIVIIVLLNSIK